MTIDRSKLRDRDWSTLWRAWTLRTSFNAGIGVYSGADAMHVHRLARLGILEYEGHGRNLDDGNDQSEGPVYALTPAAVEFMVAEIRSVRDRIVIDLSDLLATSGGTCAGRILSAPQLTSEEVDKVIASDTEPTCEAMISCWKSMPFTDRRWGRWEYRASFILHEAKPASKRPKLSRTKARAQRRTAT